MERKRVLLLSGGVGGAKLAHGLAMLGDRIDLTVVVNTGDDFEHLGLHISPDVDTVLYTLGGIANRTQGWGIEGESWRTLERLRELGGEAWFRLGDLDIATHLYRTAALRDGLPLSEITLRLGQRLGLRVTVLPVSDDPIRTRVHTDEGELAFQEYFVRRACKPRVHRVTYDGIDSAVPAPSLMHRLADLAFDAIVLAPSNPFLSLAPMLDLPGLPQLLRDRSERVIAVSPIIDGNAVKGPAAKLMAELGIGQAAGDWARYLARRYHGLVDEWVLDERDDASAITLREAGMKVRTGKILMTDDVDRRELADWLLCGRRDA